MNNQLFIVLEGIDGSGTSTQAELLKKYFQSQGDKAVISPEPSAGPIGNLIRDTLKKRIFFTSDRRLFDEQMAYLFAADRHDHLYNEVDGVFKLIEQGFHVISTRYYFSSLVYNCQTPEQFEFVSRLNYKFPNPDLVIYIDLPIEVSLKRLQERSLQEIYETENKLTQVKTNYQKIFADYQDKLLVIEGTKSIETIHQQIIEFIRLNFSFKNTLN
ncbi:Thymidylate kinase [Stanieria cyanosphaera PCC 7437]|uniref:Thymidylate kinase n=1 Tax=Stanieria cyanosphaera (strain ATCC 29371 / PCC 7437) TaxID=111780 RepID=K9XYG5_STAC7|nr:dTMP kinase [Stanieria cyanosphaera]AFZ37171.1 Thymidylate kinase [Stanieria cyanosphaera PCC 7437]